MSEYDNMPNGVAAFLILVVSFIIGLMVHSRCADNMDHIKKEAIEHGYAEWVVDQKTGASTWVWKIQAEAKP